MTNNKTPPLSSKYGNALPPMADVDRQLADCAGRVDREIAAVVTAEIIDPWSRGAINYHLGWADSTFVDLPPELRAPGGKRLRPALAMLCFQGASWARRNGTKGAKAGGSEAGELDMVVPFAAAVELVHNFSLIHDDIEDGDLTRRGRRTLWSLCGMGPALQVGNTLHALAFRSLGRLRTRGVDAQRSELLMSKLSQTVVDLTIGQHRDMAYEVADDVSTDMYMQMIAGKTAALAACATSGGALLVVGASEPQAGATLSCYQRFGLELGLGYQIRDDILGIWGEQSETGKSKTGDIRRRKKSFPIVFAFMNASPNDRRHLQRIYATTDELTSENESDIREILDDCRAAGAAQALVERQAERARAALSEAAGVEPLRDNPYLAILDELAGLLAGRTR